jgi:RHH-type proline utilization regulon transcriptional repressor/proline dehydrogenase/delta 1-pyrroline-5-carboxylate dehydrogenase
MVRLCKGAYWDSRDQAGHRSVGSATTRCSRARCRATSRTSPARAACSPIRWPSTRRSRRITHTPWRPSPKSRSAPAAATSGNSSACTAWAKRSTTRSSARTSWGRACRIYAPVGSHEDLLAYLVRRLLENGANSSFVNRIADAEPADRHADRRPGRQGRRPGEQAPDANSRCHATSSAPNAPTAKDST